MGTLTNSEDLDESCIMWHFISSVSALFAKTKSIFRERSNTLFFLKL